MPAQNQDEGLFSWTRAFARLWNRPQAKAELGERFLSLAEKSGDLAGQIAELGPPAEAVGDFGIAIAKGSPAIVAAGIVCPAWGLALLAGISAFSIYKIRRAWLDSKDAERHDALTKAIAEDFNQIGAEIKAQGEALGLDCEFTGEPRDLAAFMAAILKEAQEEEREQADQRAVGYLRSLQQSNADMLDWFKAYVDRAEEREAPIFEEFKGLRAQLNELQESIEGVRGEVQALTDRRARVAHMPAWTESFVRERRQRLYGREQWLQKNFGWIESRGISAPRHHAVIAPAGTGKSSVLAEISSRAIQSGWTVARHFLRNEYEQGASPDAAFIHLIGQLRRFRPRMRSGDHYRLGPVTIAEGLHNVIAQEAAESARTRPTLIIIDGLDESDHPQGFLDLWTDELRKVEGPLAVIVGIRRDAGDQPPAWGRVWRPEIPLPALDRAGVREWLAHAGDGSLAQRAEELSRKVLDASEGLPLLIGYLIDDLLQDPARAEEALEFGTGLEDYVQREVEALADQGDEILDVLALLAISHGPMAAPEIQQVLKCRSLERMAMDAPVRAARWWRRVSDGGRFIFAHPRLGRAFAADPRLDAPRIQGLLADWIMKNKEGYAFDWGVMHLAEAEGREEWRAEAAARATSLDYVRRKFESGQESRLHRELRRLGESGGVNERF